MRKVRSDAVLENLSTEQKDELHGWLLDERLGLKEVVERLEKQFGVKVGLDAVSRYNHDLLGTDAIEQLEDYAALAEKLPSGWEEKAAQVQAVAKYFMQLRIQEKLLLGNCTAREVIAMGKLLLKVDEVELKKSKSESRSTKSETNRNETRPEQARVLRPEMRPGPGVREDAAMNGLIQRALTAAKQPGGKLERTVNDLVDKIMVGKGV